MEDQQFNEFVDQVLSEYLRRNPNASLTERLFFVSIIYSHIPMFYRIIS